MRAQNTIITNSMWSFRIMFRSEVDQVITMRLHVIVLEVWPVAIF